MDIVNLRVMLVSLLVAAGGELHTLNASPPLVPRPDPTGDGKDYLDSLGTPEEVQVLRELQERLERLPDIEQNQETVRLMRAVLPRIESPAARWRLLVCVGDLELLQGNRDIALAAFAAAALCNTDPDSQLVAWRRWLRLTDSAEGIELTSVAEFENTLQSVVPLQRLEMEYQLATRTIGQVAESRRIEVIRQQIDAFRDRWEPLLLEGGQHASDQNLRRSYFNWAGSMMAILHLQGESAEYARRFDALGKRFPDLADDPGYLSNLLVTALGSGEVEIGRAAALLAVEKYPDSSAAAAAFFQLAVLSEEQGNLIQAIEFFRRVSESKGADASYKTMAQRNIQRLHQMATGQVNARIGGQAALTGQGEPPNRGVGWMLVWINLSAVGGFLVYWLARRWRSTTPGGDVSGSQDDG